MLVSCVAVQVAFELSRAFSDSMVLRAAARERVSDLSGLAAGMGFIASFLYLLGSLAFESLGSRNTSVMTGAWLVLFMLPLFRFCPDFPRESRSWAETRRASLARFHGALDSRLSSKRTLLISLAITLMVSILMLAALPAPAVRARDVALFPWLVGGICG